VPLYDDAAMLMGIAIATVGLFVTQLTGNSVYDDIASIGVGIVLGVVAFALGADSRALLLGEAVPPEDEKHLRKIITFFDGVGRAAGADYAFGTERRDSRYGRARHRPDRGAPRTDN
jgi:divalent metal cation (Fe/Co/Zn/Cd) transporter